MGMAVDAVGLEAHAASIAALELEGEDLSRALELVVSLLDLSVPDPATATRWSVLDLCAAATRPGRHVASVCVPPPLAPVARARLDESGVGVEELGAEAVLVERALGGYDALRRAALLAIACGARLLAVEPSPAASLCVLEAIRDVRDVLGCEVAFKAAGVRSAEDAVHQLVLVHEILGPGWLTPARCRIGGTPALLDDVLAAIRIEATG